MKLIKYKKRSPGSHTEVEKEKVLSSMDFDKFKFNNKPIPKEKDKILFITCFSEFGCESLALMYCIPRIVSQNPSFYFICVGWHGRDYLYKHLVDEFWAIKQDNQWLREYSLAFKSTSKNIANLEKSLKNFGLLFKCQDMARFCLINYCRDCNHSWNQLKHGCPCSKCGSKNVHRGILNDVQFHKKNAVKIPRPSEDALKRVEKYLKPNSIGLFARNRVCYGRNLSGEFYCNLINFLKSEGYDPIWLGERQSILPCPTKDITDFSVTNDSSNLELTLALISKLKFTVQFWTASTRFASMVDTPWILFESPDQIVGNGQEGIRIALTSDYNKKKIVLSQYKNFLENESLGIQTLAKAINEIKEGNWSDLIGLVDNPQLIGEMLKKQNLWRQNELSS